MYVKKFNETSPIVSSASHEITIIKTDTIRTIIIGWKQKAEASLVMQIAHAINQVVNHRAAGSRHNNEITTKNYTQWYSRDKRDGNASTDDSYNVDTRPKNELLSTDIHKIDEVNDAYKVKENENSKHESEDVKDDNEKLKAAMQEFIVEAKAARDDDNSACTIKSAIDLAESESAVTENKTRYHRMSHKSLLLPQQAYSAVVSGTRTGSLRINSRLRSIFSLDEICYRAPGPEEGNP